MIVAFRQHASDHATLLGNSQTLVGAQLFEVDLLVQFRFLMKNAP